MDVAKCQIYIGHLRKVVLSKIVEMEGAWANRLILWHYSLASGKVFQLCLEVYFGSLTLQNITINCVIQLNMR